MPTKGCQTEETMLSDYPDYSRSFDHCAVFLPFASNPDFQWEDEKTIGRSLKWMEAHGDYSMIMDFPAWAIGEGYFEKHKERLQAEHKTDQAKKELFDGSNENRIGLDFNTCLYQTLLNN